MYPFLETYQRMCSRRMKEGNKKKDVASRKWGQLRRRTTRRKAAGSNAEAKQKLVRTVRANLLFNLLQRALGKK